ncbi:MAG: hypothetical protein NVSMB27_24430 [Ktedonobacteraceae bacterium]
MKKPGVCFPAQCFIRAVPLLLMVIIFTSCSGSPATTTSTPTAGAASSGSGSTPTSVARTYPTLSATLAPGVKLGPQPCPDAVKAPSHWDPIISTQNGVTQVGTVSCGNLVGDTSLQALVDVYHQGTGLIIDAYVYTNITSASPKQLFKLEQLYKGDARISGNNTLITNEVDDNSVLNKDQANASLTRDLDREFAWSAGANAFVQVAFPGMFPDLMRYQAEADQSQVAQGHQLWKLNAAMTAQALAEYFLQWFPNPVATIQSGGSSHDLNAVVLVTNPDADGGTLQVTLSRLEGNINGIWEVVDVTSPGMSMTTPQSGQLLTSPPLSVTGTDRASGDTLGTATIFDHLYTISGFGYISVSNQSSTGQVSYSGYLSYTSSFQYGTQEGIMAIYLYKTFQGTITHAAMRKVLLSAPGK